MDNQKLNKNLFILFRFILIFVFILLKISDTFPQQDKYHFDKLRTSKEDFPFGINCAIKDKKGFMWFGTDYGLYRFDGYNFKVFSYKEGDSTSLSNKAVTSIFDDDKYLWIGTQQGLNRFDKTTE
ncbi:MAG: two-component regulator propeller domain-containing protein, partial [bacterium]